MQNLVKTLTFLFLGITLSGGSYAQSVAPPTVDYSKYGSMSQKMTVYRNVQSEIDAMNRERYRKFRQTVRENMPRTTTRIIVTGRNTYTQGDALRLWRQRRNTQRPRRTPIRRTRTHTTRRVVRVIRR